MPFLTPLIVRSDAPNTWTLTFPLRYQAAREKFEVPAGFETDFASIPQFLWSVFPPHGRHTRAAVLHDYLYVEAPGGISRKDVDGLFLRTMGELGTAWWRRRLMYRAVRLFGGRLWKKARRKQAKRERAK
jgi:hypothetical protein